MKVNEKHPYNAKVLQFLKKRSKKYKNQPNVELISVYEGKTTGLLGCHPEIVERVWEDIAQKMPEDGRCIIFGIPAIIHPKTGILIAFGMGTIYAINIPSDIVRNNLLRKIDRGGKIHWMEKNKSVFARDALGDSWVIGKYSSSEIGWLLKVWEAFDEKV